MPQPISITVANVAITYDTSVGITHVPQETMSGKKLLRWKKTHNTKIKEAEEQIMELVLKQQVSGHRIIIYSRLLEFFYTGIDMRIYYYGHSH